ncbi:MAG TPA: metalloregulator ArsR/SmtB family transcription factor [Candidatus Angelobacter sp.]|nr:metalloregulator ArsR/SmtB family transcription factor [Candidatus Angelobacter sp.]
MHTALFEILADPTRRRIVEVLRSGEHAVNDIVEKVCIDQSGVSRHLHILQKAGFVQVHPDGPKRLYSLRPEPFQELDAWLRTYRENMQESFNRLDAHLERMKKEVK